MDVGVAVSFSLYPRKLAGDRTRWYVRWHTAAGGRSTGKSTGCSTRSAAERWAKGKLAAARRAKTQRRISFGEWASEFWDDNGYYVTMRRAHGYSLTGGYVSNQRSIAQNYLMPRFASAWLDELSLSEMEGYLLELYSSGRSPVLQKGRYKRITPTTVNKIRQCARTMMKEARRRGLVAEDPTEGIHKFKEHPKTRGTLTRDELYALLRPESLEEVWMNDRRYYLIFLLAAATALRMGEIQGLIGRHVESDHIRVEHAWDRRSATLKAPKWNSYRIVPLPLRVGQELAVWKNEQSVGEDDLVFPSEDSLARPPSGHAIGRHFHSALRSIGIDEAQRVERNITFHSIRHGVATAARVEKVDDYVMRSAIGHRSERMFDHYSNHLGVEDFDAVRQFQERLIGRPE